MKNSSIRRINTHPKRRTLSIMILNKALNRRPNRQKWSRKGKKKKPKRMSYNLVNRSALNLNRIRNSL